MQGACFGEIQTLIRLVSSRFLSCVVELHVVYGFRFTMIWPVNLMASVGCRLGIRVRPILGIGTHDYANVVGDGCLRL